MNAARSTTAPVSAESAQKIGKPAHLGAQDDHLGNRTRTTQYPDVFQAECEGRRSGR